MTTPEERAKFILSKCLCLGQDDSLARIAAAIRQAENDKLEEAARALEPGLFVSASELVRSLKSKD